MNEKKSKKETVLDFYKIFVEGYILSDIKILLDIEKKEEAFYGNCTIPLAMTVVSAMDLLGLLIGENKENDKSENHIKEYFRVCEDVFDPLIYNSEIIEKIFLYRHGMMHNFFPSFKGEQFHGICKNCSEELLIEVDTIKSLNISVLTKDFIKSIKFVGEKISEIEDEDFFSNFLSSLKLNENFVTTTPQTTQSLVTKNPNR
jgi:hypothetical protein